MIKIKDVTAGNKTITVALLLVSGASLASAAVKSQADEPQSVASKTKASKSANDKANKRTYYLGVGILQIYARSRKNGVLRDVVAIGKGRLNIKAASMQKDPSHPDRWIFKNGWFFETNIVDKKPKTTIISFKEIVIADQDARRIRC